MVSPELKFISEQEYLDAERLAFEKHEYYKGEIFAMSGASFAHVRISKNTIISLGNSLKGLPCEPFGSDLRIHIPKNTLYTYPDISVVCNDFEATDDKFDTATNPTVLIEILSPTTRNYDQGEKFKMYREIPSLKTYITIDSENIHLIIHNRNDDDSWLMKEFKNIEDKILIDSINAELTLTDVYENVKFTN